MRIRILSVIALLTLTWPATARAGSITIQSDFGGSRVGYWFDGVRSPPVGGGGVPLGGLTMGDANIPGSSFPDTFTAYCVQILSPILETGSDGDFPFPVPYNADAASMTTWSDPMTADNGGLGGQRAAYLYNLHGTVTGADERTALQMAIWDVLYDNDFSVSLTTGRFYVDPDLPEERYANIATIANGYLQEVLTHPLDVAASDAAWLQLTFTDPRTGQTSNVQDFIGPTSVPEPSAGLILGMGMMGLVAFRARKPLLRRG